MSQDKILKEINQRIKQNLQKGQLNYLQLDSIPIRQITKQIKNILESHIHIEYLTMNDCELTSLSNFPKLDNLSILELSNNQIEEDELFHLLKCSHISHLMIDENKLRNIEKISVLRQLPNLEQLQIAGNRIGDSDFYREELFDRIPHLKIIDCHDKWGNIAINSQSEEEQQDQRNQEDNKVSSSMKEQEKSLLNLLYQQEEEKIEPCAEFEKLEQQQNLYIEKQQTVETLNSPKSVNHISGKKRVKSQQETDLNNSKIVDRNTGVVSDGSSSPEIRTFPFKRFQCYDFEE